jgi:FtsP/CotA-like multicopper oxidase with cupredoxin domain
MSEPTEHPATEHRQEVRTGLKTALGRRRLLQILGSGVATLVAAGAAFWIRDRTGRSVDSVDRDKAYLPAAENGFLPDVEIALKAGPAAVSLFPGTATRVWQYFGELLRGEPGSLQVAPGSYLGPTLRLRKGQKVRIRFTNDLPESSIVHWHGLHVPAPMDGHPRDVIAPGGSFVYEFEVINRAGTYWYHPHPHDRTGPQVYRGLAGLLLVEDEEEQRLGLPSKEYDVPLVLQDRSMDAENQFVYMANQMMEGMSGFLGDRILVNGRPDFSLSVATRAYRLRLINASNSRIYKLAWSDGTPLTVIGTDGGLLEKPVERRYVTLAPAERIELLVDFGKYPLNTKLELLSLEFHGASVSGMGRMGMIGGNATLPNGASFSVLKIHVTRQEKEPFTLPATLTAITRHSLTEAINSNAPRSFTLAMGQMKWRINERSFQMDEVTNEETVRLNTLEVWEFINQAQSSGGMGMMGGMGLAHPMHVHGGQFQVIGRQIAPELAGQGESLRDGFVDEGWKDTVLVMPGETVKLLVRFEKYKGLFLYHCHILEHEDMGMMRNYRILA